MVRLSLRYALLAFFMLLQIVFWYRTTDIVPDMSIVPDVPGKETVKAISFGDEQAFFRVLGLQIQNAGDTFGRFTALKDYDFNKLYHWFSLLDTLDDTSNYIPSMATYYFSQTQNKQDVKYVIDYLIEHSAHRISEKWWWLVQAIYLANHKLENPALALEIAKKLEGHTDIPLWAQQMPAFVYEKQGEFEQALRIIDNIIKNQDDFSRGEINFMYHFVEERLGKLEEMDEKLKKLKAINEQKEKEMESEGEGAE